MKIGNIIFVDDLVNHKKVDFINYINDTTSFHQLNNELPTLYVGWKFLKEINKNNLLIQNQSILEKKIITNKLYWEFSFFENKAQHVSGVEMFVNDLPFYFFSSQYNYINVDPVFFQIHDLNELTTHILPKKIDSYYNYMDEMLYLLKDNQVWGIDLKMYEYFDFNLDLLIKNIKEKTDKSIDDLNGEIYQKYNKIFPNFDKLKRYLIVILSK